MQNVCFLMTLLTLLSRKVLEYRLEKNPVDNLLNPVLYLLLLAHLSSPEPPGIPSANHKYCYLRGKRENREIMYLVK